MSFMYRSSGGTLRSNSRLGCYTMELQEDLSFEEQPVKILAREVKKLRNRDIPYVKVLWNNHGEREATWELESALQECYPRLFQVGLEIFWKVVDSVPTYGSHLENCGLELVPKSLKIGFLVSSRVALRGLCTGTSCLLYRYTMLAVLVREPMYRYTDDFEANPSSGLAISSVVYRGFDLFLFSFLLFVGFPPLEKFGELVWSLIEDQTSTLEDLELVLELLERLDSKDSSSLSEIVRDSFAFEPSALAEARDHGKSVA
uniref:Chromo domain-containing protein n=1 Tax=Ananas comosus var. bracteatus TaxID=296719 RepID=A0A6V7QBN8_ANACO|nr:unnamed protein product [Ananas comosus var. bracteatus]